MKVALDLLTFVLALNKLILDHQNSETNQVYQFITLETILIIPVQVIEKY